MWKYNESKHQLEEQGPLKKPKEEDFYRTDGAGIKFLNKEGFNSVKDAYLKQQLSLRILPCHESLRGKWKDGEEVPEKDFEIITARHWVQDEKYGYGCSECCNGDRCDEDCDARYKGRRQECPFCKGRGWFKEIPSIVFPLDYFGEKKTELSQQTERMFTLEEMMEDWVIFSVSTFKNATALSSLKKLSDEIEEVTYEIQHGHENLSEEYVDCMMCLLDSAARMNISISSLIMAFKEKLIKNKSREWKQNPDNTYSHIKH